MINQDLENMRIQKLWEKHIQDGKCGGCKQIGDEIYLCTKDAYHGGNCGDWFKLKYK